MTRARLSFNDTATSPTEEMREAMARARVGDDVYGDDPTVRELEATAAEVLGMEAGVLMPSGTMANLAAIMVLAGRGEEVIVERHAHVTVAEVGGLASVAGCVPLAIEGADGVLTASAIREHLRPPDIHVPRTSVICVENTHNRAGGTVTAPQVMEELRTLADEHGLGIHLDGARLFNAAVALGVPVSRLAAPADTVSVCLSKGLGAPVGSVVAGSTERVEAVRRVRKLLGGGMRQAGVLAAAGLVALRTGPQHLADDHRRARDLARRIDAVAGILADPAAVPSNIVVADVSETGLSPRELTARLFDRHGIRATARPPRHIRFVMHRDIGEPEIAELVSALHDTTRTTEGDERREAGGEDR